MSRNGDTALASASNESACEQRDEKRDGGPTECAKLQRLPTGRRTLDRQDSAGFGDLTTDSLFFGCEAVKLRFQSCHVLTRLITIVHARPSNDLPFSSERQGPLGAYHDREEPRAQPAASRREPTRERTDVAFGCCNGLLDGASRTLPKENDDSEDPERDDHENDPGRGHADNGDDD